MEPTGSTCSERPRSHGSGDSVPSRQEAVQDDAVAGAPAEWSSDNELRLAQRLAARDNSALADLIEQYEPMLRVLIGRLVAWSADRDDLVQEVFVRAWERASSFRGGSLAGWLRAIAIRRCHNHFRGLSVVRRHLQQLWLGTSRRTVNAELERRELTESTRAALQALRPADRTVLVLHYLEELSLDEVGQALGLRPATVSVRLHRARERLKEQFAANAGGAGDK